MIEYQANERTYGIFFSFEKKTSKRTKQNIIHLDAHTISEILCDGISNWIFLFVVFSVV